MKWVVCIGNRAAPGYHHIGICPRYIVSDGKQEIVFNRFLPHIRARFLAWRLNRGKESLRTIEEVKEERRRFDIAMKELPRYD